MAGRRAVREPLLLAVSGAALLSALPACAAHRAPPLPRLDADSSPLLLPGDWLVALERGPERRAVLRFRAPEGGPEPGRQHATALLSLDATANSLAASGDGRWVAVASAGAGASAPDLLLYDLESRTRGGAAGPGPAETPAWRSPAGCDSPVFDPGSLWLAMACEKSPSHPPAILLVELPSLQPLLLVGEWPRRAPAAGVDGDLYWVEEHAESSLVLRRPLAESPYVTHEISERIRSIWPQDDGSLLAELRLQGMQRGLLRLLPSGVVRDEPALDGGARGASAATQPQADSHGNWSWVRCERGPCVLVESRPRSPTPAASADLPAPHEWALPGGGHATALARVPSAGGRIPHPEDFATAPASALSTHAASQVSVLGVGLGTPFLEAWSILDRAGRHPYWVVPERPAAPPERIGVGWAQNGHCIEFVSGDRGMVAAVEIQGCGARLLSAALRPLFDRQRLASGAVPLARRFFGPGIAATVGPPAPAETATANSTVAGHDGASPPLQRTRVRYEAPERGYHFEAETQVLQGRRSVLLDTRVLLRLQAPARRQAVASP
jgi:hypothetical protein